MDNNYYNNHHYGDQTQATVDQLKMEIAKTKDPEIKANLEALLYEAEERLNKQRRARKLILIPFALIFLFILYQVVTMFLSFSSEF